MSELHDRPRLANLLRHAPIVLAFNTVIGATLAASGRGAWDVQMVYSHAIGISIWLLFDLGRFAVKRNPESGWPSGLRALAVGMVAILGGFAIGTSIGDLYCNCSTWSNRWNTAGTLLKAMGFGLVGSYFFYARGRDQYRQRQIAAAQRDAAEAQLKLLESQLEPHMLFNTLANLRVLIGMDPARAQAMLDRLIAFLRATLNGSRQRMHPLGDEFARIGDYLALMQIRMGDRLQVTLDLPAELAALPVPPLLLQPLVENAIKHGLEPQRGVGRLLVRAERDGDALRLTVQDSGLGLAASAAAPSSGSGFGVEQVRRRLATLYGEAARFTLEPAVPNGVVATVRLPVDASPTPSATPAP